jgi:ribosomal protein S6
MSPSIKWEPGMKKISLISFALINSISAMAVASSSGGTSQADSLTDYYGIEQSIECLEGYKCPGKPEVVEPNSETPNKTNVSNRVMEPTHNNTTFYVGEEVMYTNYEAKIVSIYSNGTARLKFKINGSEAADYQLSRLHKILNSLDVWNVGEKVMFADYEAEIVSIYSNGTARLKFKINGSEAADYKLSSLYKILNSLDGWNVGEEVMFANYEAEIVSIYSNGTARLKFKINGSEAANYKLSKLFKKVDSAKIAR